MVSKCAIVNCANRYDRDGANAKFFRVPKTTYSSKQVEKLAKRRQKLWIKAIKRKKLNINNSMVCSKHFISGKSAKLQDVENIDWVPTLELGYTKKVLKINLAREQRILVRCNKINENLQQFQVEPPNEDQIQLSNIEIEQEVCPNNNATCQTDIIEKKTVGCQTDMVGDDIDSLREIYRKYKTEQKVADLSLESFRGDDIKSNYMTGIADFEKMQYVYLLAKDSLTSSFVLDPFQIFLITLMRLRLDLPFTYMAYRFHVSKQTISRSFYKGLFVLFNILKCLIVWPTREALHISMPMCFKENFESSITVILDCFEVPLEKSSIMHTSAACWSNYKHSYTMKYLIRIAPQGTIIFISKAFGGRTSDKEITLKSGLLQNLNVGDVIMADRGFLIETEIKDKGARLQMPAFTLGKSQLHPLDIDKTRKIANVRIHVERVIGNLKLKYRILHQRKFPLHPLQEKEIVYDVENTPLDQIITVCCALINLGPPLVARVNDQSH